MGQMYEPLTRRIDSALCNNYRPHSKLEHALVLWTFLDSMETIFENIVDSPKKKKPKKKHKKCLLICFSNILYLFSHIQKKYCVTLERFWLSLIWCLLEDTESLLCHFNSAREEKLKISPDKIQNWSYATKHREWKPIPCAWTKYAGHSDLSFFFLR